MNETTEQIESHIRHTRDDLSANLNELEQKVKSVADWRHHYSKSPGAFLATALGGGVLLALATRPSRPRPVVLSSAAVAPAMSGAPRQPASQGPLGDSISVIKGALIGLAADHVKTMLSSLLPGFETHLRARERPKTSGAPPPGEKDGSTGIG